jgi:hypothetical protein
MCGTKNNSLTHTMKFSVLEKKKGHKELRKFTPQCSMVCPAIPRTTKPMVRGIVHRVRCTMFRILENCNRWEIKVYTFSGRSIAKSLRFYHMWVWRIYREE